VPDMLVKLYSLAPAAPACERLRALGVDVRRALPPEKHLVMDWVQQAFSRHWASEVDVAFASRPVSCHVATRAGEMVGFACYDATCRGFFGPTGVAPEHRGQGIGAALLLVCLEAMQAVGYGYAIIGGAGPTDFYTRVCGAQVIEGSQPGIYRGMLRGPAAT
jgi:GNAT superfamily N-acetyltransferase